MYKVDVALAEEMMILAKKNFPALDAPPSNISKKALTLWKNHVWPKYKAVIKKAEKGWVMADRHC